ncbi:hypothetical protein J4211_04230 [Candidatus Woesearchaeota archaeon]|nr:hypothetical protein [Candidatus Woesearchaeota archaeon]
MNKSINLPAILERIVEASKKGDETTAKTINHNEFTPLLRRALGLGHRDMPANTQFGQFIDQTRNMALNITSDIYTPTERAKLMRDIYARIEQIKEQIGYFAVLNV